MALVAPVTDDVGTAVIDAERRGEGLGVMACSAIGGGYQVIYRGRLAGRINAVGIVMAAVTGQFRGVDQAVIEYSIETEGGDAVAVATIDGRRIDSARKTYSSPVTSSTLHDPQRTTISRASTLQSPLPLVYRTHD